MKERESKDADADGEEERDEGEGGDGGVGEERVNRRKRGIQRMGGGEFTMQLLSVDEKEKSTE